jgi:predicted NAD/FAD-binding protein
MRIAVVGGGIAGLGAAWLLDEEHQVLLFEKGEILGGHARSVEVACEGRRVTVDTAFQYLSPSMYPTFARLLDILGVATVPVRASFSIHAERSQRTFLLTPSPRARDVRAVLHPESLAWLLQLRHTLGAAVRVERSGDFALTVAELVERLRVTTGFRREVLYPFLSALHGTSLDDTKAMSARAALMYPVHHRPRNVLVPFELREIAGGAARYVRALAGSLRQAEVRTGVAIERVLREGAGYALVDARGARHLVDQVVLAAPADRAADLLADLPHAAALRERLAALRFTDATIAVHADARRMPSDRADWSYCNVLHAGSVGRLSIWKGRDAGVDVFKSWIDPGAEVRELYGQYAYRHVLMSPAYFRLQDLLPTFSGQHGLWLAGSYTRHIDSHESGLLSAVEVARHLSPGSVRLAQLMSPCAGVAEAARRTGATCSGPVGTSLEACTPSCTHRSS